MLSHNISIDIRFYKEQVLAPWHLHFSLRLLGPSLGSCLGLCSMYLSPVFLLLEHTAAFPPSLLLWFRPEEALRPSSIRFEHRYSDKPSTLLPCSLRWA
ncbi:hypothetical protein Q7C36_003820 [Tachysurus vachellii]|uniref:Uncharacterized protein n=1 Tax=Tachysurus vachellii TaxID=175792 RepID=A0AA88NSI7_TACVA|nr:hypothetical protein Q7C36_003820 [Tachysurus vachellii]